MLRRNNYGTAEVPGTDILIQVGINKKELLAEIKKQIKDDCNTPFPHNEVGRLLCDLQVDWKDFVSDLNQHWREVVGSASSVEDMTDLSPDMLLTQHNYYSLSFFERWVQYKAAKPLINQVNYPHLYDFLSRVENIRVCLVSILAGMLADTNAPPVQGE